MSLFNPWVILGIVLAVLGSFGAGYSIGELNEYERQQLEIAALNAKARETEQAMAKVAQTYAETLRKANNVAKIKENRLRDDIATGALKLRVKASCAVPAATDTATASGDTGKQQPSLTDELLKLLSTSPAEATKPSAISTPASTNTKP
jgi:hypothetical protein